MQRTGVLCSGHRLQTEVESSSIGEVSVPKARRGVKAKRSSTRRHRTDSTRGVRTHRNQDRYPGRTVPEKQHTRDSVHTRAREVSRSKMPRDVQQSFLHAGPQTSSPADKATRTHTRPRETSRRPVHVRARLHLHHARSEPDERRRRRVRASEGPPGRRASWVHFTLSLFQSFLYPVLSFLIERGRLRGEEGMGKKSVVAPPVGVSVKLRFNFCPALSPVYFYVLLLLGILF